MTRQIKLKKLRADTNTKHQEWRKNTIKEEYYKLMYVNRFEHLHEIDF